VQLQQMSERNCRHFTQLGQGLQVIGTVLMKEISSSRATVASWRTVRIVALYTALYRISQQMIREES
jgi:hypothetical protein